MRIVIATDNDAPGDALAEELARRLGRERCWRVRWPLTQADHEYAGRLSGVALPEEERQQQQGEGGEQQQGSAAAGAAAAAATPAAAAAGGVPAPRAAYAEAGAAGSHTSSGGGAAAASVQPPAYAEVEVEPRSSETLLAPRIEPPHYRKDANEVLVRDGPEMLGAFISNAEPFPIRGLLRWAGGAGREGRGGGAQQGGQGRQAAEQQGSST